MDLNYGPQYEDFKKEVQSFCNEYKDLRFVDSYRQILDPYIHCKKIEPLF